MKRENEFIGKKTSDHHALDFELDLDLLFTSVFIRKKGA